MGSVKNYNRKELEELVYRLFRASANLNLHVRRCRKINHIRMANEMTEICRLYNEVREMVFRE